MKSFLKYIKEDIEVMGSEFIPYMTVFRKFDEHQINYLKNPFSGDLKKAPEKVLTDHGDLDENHKLYSMVYSGYDKPSDPVYDTHHYYVVNKQTNDIATVLKTKAYDNPYSKKKLLQISELATHPDYRKKKIGSSLATMLYSRLSEMGHPIQSSSLQSQGGAHLWNEMRKHPETGPRMFLQRPTFDVLAHGGEAMIPAMNLKDSDIWGVIERKQTVKQKVKAEQDPSKVSTQILSNLLLLPPGTKQK